MLLNAKTDKEYKRRQAVESDALLKELRKMSPEELETYLEQNIKSFVDVRMYLKLLIQLAIPQRRPQ